MNPPLPLGTVVDVGGGLVWKIDAVMRTGGERYYMLTNGTRDVAMWPAFMVEEAAAERYETCIQCAGSGKLYGPRGEVYECENCDVPGFVLMRKGVRAGHHVEPAPETDRG